MTRDLVGYGGNPPKVRWPGGAKLALTLNVNFEEGAELAFEDGDPVNENILGVVGPSLDGRRDTATEQIFNYGSRAGLWRILDALDRHARKATFLMCARAVERLPEAAAEVVRRGHEPLCHGYKWTNHALYDDPAEERRLIEKMVSVIGKVTGERPHGFICRWAQSEHTRRLLIEEGGFLYDSNAFDDDLPYYDYQVPGGPMLIVPYSIDTNDQMFFEPYGPYTPDHFLDYLVAAVETLLAEGERGAPKMMNLGLHLRIIGRPARFAALEKFLAYLDGLGERVWVARRIDIARFWLEAFPPDAAEAWAPVDLSTPFGRNE